MVDARTAPIVVEVYKRYADGESVRSIITDFNNRGLTNIKRNPYNMSSFHTVLKNRKYIGEYKYQDIVIPDAVPAIVDKVLFFRVSSTG